MINSSSLDSRVLPLLKKHRAAKGGGVLSSIPLCHFTQAQNEKLSQNYRAGWKGEQTLNKIVEDRLHIPESNQNPPILGFHKVTPYLKRY